MQYVPLHLHTENSLLDGAIRIKDLCKFAKENDMPAVAITDHGNMYGAIQMYETAKENGLIEDQIAIYTDLARMLNIDVKLNAQNICNCRCIGKKCCNGCCPIC